MPRSLRAADLEPALRLWDRAGGWYRATLPVTERMVRSSLEKLVVARSRFGRSAPVDATAQVITGASGDLEAMVYVRADGSGSYAAPVLLEGPQASTSCAELLSLARSFLAEQGVDSFLVEAPAYRASVRAAVLRAGEARWRRTVYLKSDPAPVEPEGPGVVPFRASWARSVVELGRRRFPEGAPAAAPVPFLEVSRPSRSPIVAPLKGTRIWVLLDGRVLLGVVGAARFPEVPVGEVGPFLLDAAVDPARARPLLRAALRWLGETGAVGVRASVPAGLEREERALHDEGFARVAEADVVEVATGAAS